MNDHPHHTLQQDFDVGSLYSGTYLKADDLNGKTYIATITAVERVEVQGDDGTIREKAAIALQGWSAKLLLNKTNFEAIAAVYGRQSAGWLGKPIEVYPDTTLWGGRTVPCVRVRVPRPTASTAAVPRSVLQAPGKAMGTPSTAVAAAPNHASTAASTTPPGAVVEDMSY